MTKDDLLCTIEKAVSILQCVIIAFDDTPPAVYAVRDMLEMVKAVRFKATAFLCAFRMFR